MVLEVENSLSYEHSTPLRAETPTCVPQSGGYTHRRAGLWRAGTNTVTLFAYESLTSPFEGYNNNASFSMN